MIYVAEKIAMSLYAGGLNGFNRVMHPIRAGSGGSLTTGVGLTFTYQIENNIRQHVFRPEMYLLPIMDEEMAKMPAMIQTRDGDLLTSSKGGVSTSKLRIPYSP